MAPRSSEHRHGDDGSESVTKTLCHWIHSVSLNDVPEDVRTRAKYLILDGLGCAIVGAHLPWTETAARAIFDMEPAGNCSVWGWQRKLGPLAAALLNSTAVQAFELDDYHSEAPLHSNSILLPALFAAAKQTSESAKMTVDGTSFLLATIVGYETGPRVGLGLYGGHMLSRGWHSGVVFGHAAAAASVSKLLNLSDNAIEDALGIACTQACGLMSAQFGSDVKRMQHGFAARNGLFAALMAKGNYVGIKRVFEEPYGGFLAVFGQGSGMDPPYRTEEVTKGLGEKWQLQTIRVKPYASMAGTHCTIDCIRELQKKYPEQLRDLKSITSIKIEMSEAAFKHGGWKAKRPLTATGAQMSAAYIAAVQLVDGQVLPSEFRNSLLDRDCLWELIDKTECVHTPELDPGYAQRVTITFDGQPTLTQVLQAPRGVNPALTNEEILEKWRRFTQGLIEDKRRDEIESLVLNLENVEDVTVLEDLLAGPTLNPIA
ncbi:hypothetical protein VTN77DRAFT_1973 [Rasamsonia byssochlamydoides]|uniref:uncharacterized protein n=1 Tax=Rasamsonia byssochlamydoides TaxID=89139 RepID=UPI0037443621